jgi:hypothetical protein
VRIVVRDGEILVDCEMGELLQRRAPPGEHIILNPKDERSRQRPLTDWKEVSDLDLPEADSEADGLDVETPVALRQMRLFEPDVEPELPVFVCDVVVAYPAPWQAYHCMDTAPHDLEGAHLFGTTHDGLHERTWGDALLKALGRCDLAQHPLDGYSLVPNHLVRAYPLDPDYEAPEPAGDEPEPGTGEGVGT